MSINNGSDKKGWSSLLPSHRVAPNGSQLATAQMGTEQMRTARKGVRGRVNNVIGDLSAKKRAFGQFFFNFVPEKARMPVSGMNKELLTQQIQDSKPNSAEYIFAQLGSMPAAREFYSAWQKLILAYQAGDQPRILDIDSRSTCHLDGLSNKSNLISVPYSQGASGFIFGVDLAALNFRKLIKEAGIKVLTAKDLFCSEYGSLKLNTILSQADSADLVSLIHTYPSLEAIDVLENAYEEQFSGKNPGINCKSSVEEELLRMWRRYLQNFFAIDLQLEESRKMLSGKNEEVLIYMPLANEEISEAVRSKILTPISGRRVDVSNCDLLFGVVNFSGTGRKSGHRFNGIVQNFGDLAVDSCETGLDGFKKIPKGGFVVDQIAPEALIPDEYWIRAAVLGQFSESSRYGDMLAGNLPKFFRQTIDGIKLDDGEIFDPPAKKFFTQENLKKLLGSLKESFKEYVDSEEGIEFGEDNSFDA